MKTVKILFVELFFHIHTNAKNTIKGTGNGQSCPSAFGIRTSQGGDGNIINYL